MNGLDSDAKEADVSGEGPRGPKLSRLDDDDDVPIESGDRNLETEFNTLKTLIPGLSERTNLEEVKTPLSLNNMWFSLLRIALASTN